MPTSSPFVSVQDIHAPKPVMNRTIPPFLNKLYNILNDPQTNDLIHWSERGDSFIVRRKQEFEKKVLPQFFRHDRFATFVRQLNMYGFHKVPHLQDGALHAVGGGFDELEYQNPYFCRDQPDLLIHVTRKKSREEGGGLDVPSHEGNNLSSSSNSLKQILDEIAAIKNHQTAINADLKLIQKDNQDLWEQMKAGRERDQQQQDTVDKILQFLASVFSAPGSVADKHPHNNSNRGGKKRPLLIDSNPTTYQEEERLPSKVLRTTSPYDKQSSSTIEPLKCTLPLTTSSNPPDTCDGSLSTVPISFFSHDNQDNSEAPAYVPFDLTPSHMAETNPLDFDYPLWNIAPFLH